MGKNEILLFATTCVKLEDIMLSEISHTKKNTVYHSYAKSKNAELRKLGQKAE